VKEGEPAEGLPYRLRRVRMVGRRRDGRLLWAPSDAHLPGEADARRKRIRLPQEWYAAPGQAFFITICSHERRELFVAPRYAEPVFDALLHGRLAREADLSAACLMPDHLHVLVAPTETNLLPLLGAWKSYTTYLLHGLGVQGQVWQRSFYDHAIREGDGDATEYTVSDPERSELVADRRTYPYVWWKWGPL
jgi:putative transposase